MKIKMENTKNLSIQELYAEVAKKLGYDTTAENILYDCRNIDIAENIQDNFYEYYCEKAGNNDHDTRVSITMLLAIAGPKVNHDLADDEVEVYDNFVSFEEK